MLFRGVRRQAFVPNVPSSACVIQSLKSTPGVTNVRYEARTVGGRTLTLTGLKPPDTFHDYFYDIQGHSGNLYFSEDYKGRVEFIQGYLRLNKTPPQAEIDIIRPVMRQLESRLEVECGLPDLAVNIKEMCFGVKCPK